MIHYVDLRGKDKNTADIKAPDDMCEIMRVRGYNKILFARPKTNGGRLNNITTNLSNWFSALKILKRGDTLVYQYPLGLRRNSMMMFNFVRSVKKLKLILLIHDVDSIRGYNVKANAWKEKIFFKADAIICHNDRMKKWLIDFGLPSEKLFPLKIFDYLQGDSYAKTTDTNDIILAGNLSTRKSPYIGKLLDLERGYNINLYGPNLENSESYKNSRYFGSFAPSELTKNLEGRFGLVWDGDSVEECSGMTGVYLKYNNPHKVSLYISSGIPVIIWKQAALADYITENNFGIAIDSLNDLGEALKSVDEGSYGKMREAVLAESKKLRSGYYLNSVLDEIESKLN
ncbi:MAG: hypothetical protein K6F83_00725 [Clostridiales bacterium]|nr:hypothetical protein [Clostridiales bacterium]